jgi:hypothetical protein
VLGLRVGARLMMRTAMRLRRGLKPESEYGVGDRALVVGVSGEGGRQGGTPVPLSAVEDGGKESEDTTARARP